MAGSGECWEKTSKYKECDEYFSFERVKAKKFMKDAEKEKQEGIQGQWQRESLAKEYLAQEIRMIHSQNDDQKIFCGRRLGGTKKHLQGRKKSDGMGFRKNTRDL